ncbi:MAG TPA: TIGR00730 family Rossman fold protein [Elusimicrobia bacterium]|nr:MAG: Rossman fold protein, TIGR00730 family [Elusimicrobia bacterium GWA2_64_40]OGR66378.1 MAG: Rossman fold protein, TIGR00730 family [Elusimicrobia bacterium GWB2_63_16]HAN03780.1 TIGR00730 family Rossman fold protein [Elusimicrobiota bacterium]HAU89611.1 TIGR00730 family Rossman fold protein [Elusimicrobiota bacterium]
MNKKPKISKEVLTLRRSKAYRKAYLDPEFLSSDAMRPVRLQLELQKPEMTLSEHGVKSTVVVFGSARIWDKPQSEARAAEVRAMLRKDPKNPVLKSKLASVEGLKKSVKYYDVARDFGRLVSQADVFKDRKLVVVTGGGPGIMEAANRGAHDAGAKNIGLNITLDMEQGPNPYISPEFCFRFHYFAIRKMHFVMRARALVAFPGGFGTMDELFEVLTLVQTGKKTRLPIVLVGKDYWQDVINFPNMAKWGYIAKEDLKLFRYAETGAEILRHIEDFYKVYPLANGK